MTLDELRDAELSLMRKAFERACTLAGVALGSDETIDEKSCARIAVVVQTLVERGVSDPAVIARCAVCKSQRTDPDSEQFHFPTEDFPVLRTST